MLKETYIELLKRYTTDNTVISDLWTEVEQQHSKKKRHYHTLQHLENLLMQLDAVNSEIENRDAILFSLYYHDIIYNSLKSDNEEKSAKLAEERMKQLDVSNKTIVLCVSQILATKSHIKSINNDTNYFTDADLSILGQAWEIYEQYCRDVRKEYSIFPDIVYKPGRRKVLAHFLAMERIFKTDYFYNKFEKQAKLNLQKEMKLL